MSDSVCRMIMGLAREGVYCTAHDSPLPQVTIRERQREREKRYRRDRHDRDIDVRRKTQRNLISSLSLSFSAIHNGACGLGR